MYKSVLIISDNIFLITNFKKIISDLDFKYTSFAFSYSYNNKFITENDIKSLGLTYVNVKADHIELLRDYDLIISLHCKQIFPEMLVNSVKCINIHPGFNPYNRGWYPQVFSIINGLKVGATIHEIDIEIDHGPIICKKELEIFEWDTSLTLYERTLRLELELIRENITSIIENNYIAQIPSIEGNYNSISDLDKLCEIDLDKIDTVGNVIRKLRALTHGSYDNAYFRDKNGEKIYIQVLLKK